MSRSYKKNTYVTDGYGGDRKRSKQIANRTVRRRIRRMDEDMPARIQHKKMTETWNICDYKWRMTKNEAIEWYYDQIRQYETYGVSERFLKRYPTLEAWLKYWDKCYRRK